jgi:hypothetical protein
MDNSQATAVSKMMSPRQRWIQEDSGGRQRTKPSNVTACDSSTCNQKSRAINQLENWVAPSSNPFCERFGLIASPSDPYHLFLVLKDVRALIPTR